MTSTPASQDRPATLGHHSHDASFIQNASTTPSQSAGGARAEQPGGSHPGSVHSNTPASVLGKPKYWILHFGIIQ